MGLKGEIDGNVCDLELGSAVGGDEHDVDVGISAPDEIEELLGFVDVPAVDDQDRLGRAQIVASDLVDDEGSEDVLEVFNHRLLR